MAWGLLRRFKRQAGATEKLDLIVDLLNEQNWEWNRMADAFEVLKAAWEQEKKSDAAIVDLIKRLLQKMTDLKAQLDALNNGSGDAEKYKALAAEIEAHTTNFNAEINDIAAVISEPAPAEPAPSETPAA